MSGGIGKVFRIHGCIFQLPRGFFNLLNMRESLQRSEYGARRTSDPFEQSRTGGFGYLNYTGIAGNSVSSSLPTPTGQIVAHTVLGSRLAVTPCRLGIAVWRCCGPAATPPSIRFQSGR